MAPRVEFPFVPKLGCSALAHFRLNWSQQRESLLAPSEADTDLRLLHLQYLISQEGQVLELDAVQQQAQIACCVKMEPRQTKESMGSRRGSGREGAVFPGPTALMLAVCLAEHRMASRAVQSGGGSNPSQVSASQQSHQSAESNLASCTCAFAFHLE